MQLVATIVSNLKFTKKLKLSISTCDLKILKSSYPNIGLLTRHATSQRLAGAGSGGLYHQKEGAKAGGIEQKTTPKGGSYLVNTILDKRI